VISVPAPCGFRLFLRLALFAHIPLILFDFNSKYPAQMMGVFISVYTTIVG
jgi:hypothetical protein